MKTRLTMIVFLVFIWLGFSSNFTIGNLLVGIFFSTLVNFLIFNKPMVIKVNLWHLFTLVLFTLWELILSSLEVAWDVLTPTDLSKPGFITLPLEISQRDQMSLLANIISLTPGTLSIDLNVSKQEIRIHVMFMQNEKKISSFIKEYLEPKVMKVLNYDK